MNKSLLLKTPPVGSHKFYNVRLKNIENYQTLITSLNELIIGGEIIKLYH